MNLLGLLESVDETGDGPAVDGFGGDRDAVAEVGGETAYYEDGGGVEEHYVSGWARLAGEDCF
jgi:hypothetical protein